MPTRQPLELIQDVQLMEEAGEYVRALRKIYVEVAGQSNLGDILFAALDKPGVPQPGDKISDAIPRLCVRRRTPKLVGWSAASGLAKIQLDIEYELERPDRGYPLRGGSNVSQIEMAKNIFGRYVTYSYRGKTYKGKWTQFAPEAFETRITTEETNTPGILVKKWLCKVNADEWMDEPNYHWMCTRVEYDLISANTDPHRYEFTWEFQKSASPDGWRVWLVYQNPDGTVPEDAEFYQVDAYMGIPFSQKFPWKEGEVKA